MSQRITLPPLAPPSQEPPAPSWLVNAAKMLSQGQAAHLTPALGAHLQLSPPLPSSAHTPPQPSISSPPLPPPMPSSHPPSLLPEEPPSSLSLLPQPSGASEPSSNSPRPPPLPSNARSRSTAQLRVYVGTWNMHGKDPPSSLAPWLPAAPTPSPLSDGFDMYVIGTQEAERSIEKSVINPSKAKWVERLRAELGEEYACVASHSLVAIHLAVYVKRERLHEVSAVQSAHVACGVADIIGNKGGVGISLSIGATSILCINSHLAAHQHKVSERNADFHRINNLLGLRPPNVQTDPLQTSTNGGGCTALFDRVIWCGDLNYRVQGCRAVIDALLQPANEHARSSAEWAGEEAHWEAMLAVLLNNDQLLQQMRLGHVFNGFKEAEIKFRPTYKFDSKVKHLYDQSGKLRVPAYTDRVLYRVRDSDASSAVQVLRYDYVPEICSSDHKPVFAELLIEYEPSTNTASAGQRHVMVKRVARSGITPATSDKSAVCAIM